MSLLIESLGLGHLSTLDRLRLAQELWASVGESAIESLLTEEQIQELDRRIDADDRNPDEGTSWDEVKARLRHRPS